MALPDTLAARLIETVKDHDLSGRIAMLGRQRWVGSRKGASAKLFQDTIEKYLPGIAESELHNAQDEYSETFFAALGFQQIDSIDYSDFEGASIVHDLTKPPTEDLIGAFDVIYDGGTCEHIFDLPRAFETIDALLKPGGVLIGHSPCNNWTNHAFYQFGPELVYGYWERSMNYDLLDLVLQPLLPSFALQTSRTTNPNETGLRPRIRNKLPNNSRIILNYAVRKPLTGSAEITGVYQGDYERKWGKN